MRTVRTVCGLLALAVAFALGVLAGRGSVTATDAPTDTPALSAETGSPQDAVLLAVPPLGQHPDYPTGCEVVCAAMALQFAGKGATVDELIDSHLPTSRDWYWYGGRFYGPDPNEVFCGDPRSEQSYGCVAPLIEKMLLSYLGDNRQVINATGLSLSTLCTRYIDIGVPVLVWATVGMNPLTDGRSWILPDGSDFTWPTGEHCLLLIGYDGENYYFNDPTDGKRVAYVRITAEQRYEEMGRQALAVMS
ncbi:MAG: C39 family peptidase [Clostridia bacterium]|nr:C39 family peptidase [Clostridia bacterium]